MTLEFWSVYVSEENRKDCMVRDCKIRQNIRRWGIDRYLNSQAFQNWDPERE